MWPFSPSRWLRGNIIIGPMMKNSGPVFFSMDSLPQCEGLTEGMGDTTGTRGVKETPRIKSEASRRVAITALPLYYSGHLLKRCRAEKEIPSKVQLLPGQVLKLQEVLTQERRRTQPLPSLPVPPRPPPLPSASPSNLLQKPTDRTESSTVFPECFFRVSRQEAEQMLEANPENGGLIMRPATIANSYAVTLRLLTPSGHVMKNYRVSSTKSGFIIRLDTPVTVSSLHDAVRYFQERTEFRLVPYSPSELYDTQIDLPTPPRDTRTTPLHPGLAPWCKVVPRHGSQEAKDLPPPEAVDGGYVYPDSHITDDLKLGETPARLDQEGVWKKVIYTSADEEEQLYEN
ncbi:hypothetical protein fugu_013803 [Takifugu bimaculatus]|uniref:SH2 domain-containing protein n=1 Tax=Takifugu bimaculatus TaxID=433685 RepID=A0A4Z2C4A6_9TELE|nr:hypothetical protein fugu_013803 [Takifugu bimaculatus]